MDEGLVEAYQTRRVLDRLYGYEVSPVLWKKVMPQLSAGRVQSVAVRLVVDRERERIAFRAARYWDLEAVFAKVRAEEGDAADVASFPAALVSVDGRRVAQGRDFSSTGELKTGDQKTQDVLHLDGEAAAALADRLGDASFSVSSVERKPYRRSPYAPFRTTTLQQEASRKLGFSSKYAMSVAQRLTRTATSPICGPTRPRCRRPRSPRPGRRPASCTARTTCRTRRASTPAR